jgi:hypothetical protein
MVSHCVFRGGFVPRGGWLILRHMSMKPGVVVDSTMPTADAVLQAQRQRKEQVCSQRKDYNGNLDDYAYTLVERCAPKTKRQPSQHQPATGRRNSSATRQVESNVQIAPQSRSLRVQQTHSHEADVKRRVQKAIDTLDTDWKAIDTPGPQAFDDITKPPATPVKSKNELKYLMVARAAERKQQHAIAFIPWAAPRVATKILRTSNVQGSSSDDDNISDDAYRSVARSWKGHDFSNSLPVRKAVLQLASEILRSRIL